MRLGEHQWRRQLVRRMRAIRIANIIDGGSCLWRVRAIPITWWKPSRPTPWNMAQSVGAGWASSCAKVSKVLWVAPHGVSLGSTVALDRWRELCSSRMGRLLARMPQVSRRWGALLARRGRCLDGAKWRKDSVYCSCAWAGAVRALSTPRGGRRPCRVCRGACSPEVDGADAVVQRRGLCDES